MDILRDKGTFMCRGLEGSEVRGIDLLPARVKVTCCVCAWLGFVFRSNALLGYLG